MIPPNEVDRQPERSTAPEVTAKGEASDAAMRQKCWPQDALEAVNVRWGDAIHREINAGTIGDLAAKEQATRDVFDAMGDRQDIRTEVSEGIIGLLRIALEENPVALSKLLEQVPSHSELIEAVAALEARLDGGAK